MTSDYFGHYPYSRNSIQTTAPDRLGVYYCGLTNSDWSLGTLYVGRAAGESVTIKSRLLDHLGNDYWPDVTHFGFRTCSTENDAIDLEAAEIRRLQPKYNVLRK